MVTEDPTDEYIKAIKSAKTAKDLVKAIEPFKKIADDAYKRALQLSDEGVKQFHKDWKAMNKPQPDQRAIELSALWADIIMPRKIFAASFISMTYKCPWGLAYIRSEEQGWPWEKKGK